jgi:hypothetical protein
MNGASSLHTQNTEAKSACLQSNSNAISNENTKNRIVSQFISDRPAYSAKHGDDGAWKLPLTPSKTPACASLHQFKSVNPECCTFKEQWKHSDEAGYHPTRAERQNGWHSVFVLQWKEGFLLSSGQVQYQEMPNRQRVFLVSNCGDFTPAQLPNQCVNSNCITGG